MNTFLEGFIFFCTTGVIFCCGANFAANLKRIEQLDNLDNFCLIRTLRIEAIWSLVWAISIALVLAIAWGHEMVKQPDRVTPETEGSVVK